MGVWQSTPAPKPAQTDLLSTPFRDPPEWDLESLERLREEIRLFTPPEGSGVKAVKILLLGLVGAGKSSFFNTVNNAYTEALTNQAECGSASTSLTLQYWEYKVQRDKYKRKPLQFRICDTRGLENKTGEDVIHARNIQYFLDGNIPHKHQFDASMPISPQMVGFKTKTTLKDRIHCVGVVVDGSTVKALPASILTDIRAIQDVTRRRGIPMKILVTKVDKISREVSDDVRQVFRSESVRNVVDRVAEVFEMPRNLILLVKNYESETEPKPALDILALIALKAMLNTGSDYISKNTEERSGKCMLF